MHEIWILLGYNLYDTKLHFSRKFHEALQRYGLKTRLVNIHQTKMDDLVKEIASSGQQVLCCSFDHLIKYTGSYAFWDRHRIPCWHILLDPPAPGYGHVKSDYSIVSCVDHFGCRDLRAQNCSNVFFWGHGVERELAPAENQDKPYDVVYLGTCYDPEGLDYYLSRLPKEQILAVKNAIKSFANESTMSMNEAVWKAIHEHNIPDTEFSEILYLVDNFIRGYDRLQLIRSIKDAKIHIFGGACFRPTEVKGWNHYFAGNPNVIVHPAVKMPEAIEIMKKSKICFNSMPFFKNGTHERLFMGPACGCLMVSTDTIWTRKNFVDGEDMILYKPRQLSEVNDKVNYYLAHEEERRRMAEKARQKVMKAHTWDHRVEELMQVLPDFLKSLP